jgi:predicted alpha/beta hydrolase family esterase
MPVPAGRCESFLILHGIGYDGDPDHWHNRLAGRLREAGRSVHYPRLPNPETPSLGEWLTILREQLETMDRARGRIVICHSLGCLLWLHHAPSLERPVDRLLLVAPPEDGEIPAPGAEFAIGSPDVAALRASSIAPPRLARGEADPYSPTGVPSWAVEAGAEIDELQGAEHINPDDGHGPWPSCESWCFDPATRLAP